MAAASKSALTSPPRCGLIVCVPISHAAWLRATSQLRAHCPLLWPQMAHKRFSRLDGRLWQLLQAQFDATCAAAALHAIRIMLEDRALPSAASERVFCMLSCVGSLVSPPGPLPQSVTS